MSEPEALLPLYRLLDKSRQDPAAYLAGVPTAEKVDICLGGFYFGFNMSVRRSDSLDDDPFWGFRDWLAAKWEDSSVGGFARLIERYYGPEDSFERFYTLLAEYKAAQGHAD